MKEFPPFPVSRGPALGLEETVCLTSVHLGTPGRERRARTGGVLLLHGEKECLFKHFFAVFSMSDKDSPTSHRRPTFSVRHVVFYVFYSPVYSVFESFFPFYMFI